MPVKQLSIFVDDKSGSLKEVTKILGEAGIKIRTVSVSEIGEFGIIRIVVDSIKVPMKILQEKGFTVGSTEVLVIDLGKNSGGISYIAEIFEKNEVNIEHAYTSGTKSNGGALIVKVDDTEAGDKALRKADIPQLKSTDLCSL